MQKCEISDLLYNGIIVKQGNVFSFFEKDKMIELVSNINGNHHLVVITAEIQCPRTANKQSVLNTKTTPHS